MMRALSLIALFATAAVALALISEANAWESNKYCRGEIGYEDWVVPPPPGESLWCN